MTKEARSAVQLIASTSGPSPHPSLLRRNLEGTLVGLSFGVGAIVTKIPIVASAGGDLGYVLYVAAIALASWFRGFSGGVVATVVSGFLNTYVFVHPGQLFPLETSEQVRFIVYLGSGAVVAALFRSLRVERDTIARSLAEQARLAAQIADRDERLELVLAGSRTGIWDVDVPTGAVVWSDQMYEQAERTRELGPADLETLVHRDDAERLRAEVRRAIAERRSFSTDVRLALPAERWVHLRGRAFYEGDQPVRILGTSEDITERVLVERQRTELELQKERALEFQRAFVDVLSHELRTPMTTIYAAAEMLRRPHTSLGEGDRLDLLGDIHDETRRLDGLIENLLVLSRAERTSIEAADEPVELRRSIDAAIRLESGRWPGIAFRVEIDDELPIAAGSDAYVGRILANLLSNAGKYASPGGTVTVQATATAREVVVLVLDDGIGLDGDPARLFELFYRSPSASKHAAGSGIGLFVCARLVEAMGGRIWGRARPDGGAEFGFALRRLERPTAVASAPKSGAAAFRR